VKVRILVSAQFCETSSMSICSKLFLVTRPLPVAAEAVGGGEG